LLVTFFIFDLPFALAKARGAKIKTKAGAFE
jgi:hypothetical protein